MTGHNSSTPTSATVSVIIPVLDRAHLLGDAVDSVLRQEGVHVEVIIVDDGSTDGSLDVARQLAASDERILVDSLDTNQGPATARNVGLRLASADFITFLDSDDLMAPGRLDRQLQEVPREGLVLVVGRQRIIVADGVVPPRSILAEQQEPDNYYIMTMCGSRQTFDAIGLFDETYRVAEDLEYLVRSRRLGVEIKRIDVELVTRRVLGDNLVEDDDALQVARLRIYREHLAEGR